MAPTLNSVHLAATEVKAGTPPFVKNCTFADNNSLRLRENDLITFDFNLEALALDDALDLLDVLITGIFACSLLCAIMRKRVLGLRVTGAYLGFTHENTHRNLLRPAQTRRYRSNPGISLSESRAPTENLA